jgi:cellobiose phosphorylase
VFQALEGLIYYDKDVARAKILEALNFITVEGRCPRQYVLPKVKGEVHSMDLRPFIDQGVWVISTIISYLKLTKNYDLLKATCGYYDFLDETKHLARQSQVTGTVAQHMIAIMGFLLKNRDKGHTECVCALCGDWNDALDGLGKTNKSDHGYGTGVSVMATLQVYQNLTEMMSLGQLLDPSYIEFDEALMQSYGVVKEQIKQGLLKYAVVDHEGERKILHGWGDDYSYGVGSFSDLDGVSRDGLTSNAFWILSDMINEDRTFIDPIMKALGRLESNYGYKTFEPHFEKNSEGVGRIGNLPPGTAENGAAYSHASLFGIMALFKIGESQKAWEELVKVMPFTHEHISCSPFVMPNSYGYNEAYHIDGESMSDWQTGSSNVLLKALIKYVAGFEPSYEGVFIQPAEFSPFKDMILEVSYKGCLLKIIISKGEGERSFKVNGEAYEGTYDPMMKVKKLWLKDEWITSKEMVIEVIG